MEQQIYAREQIEAALRRIGVTEPVGLGNGIITAGGTPAHRWLEVTVAGVPTGVKILVSSEEDISTELDRATGDFFAGVPREHLDVIRPSIWPIPMMFPHW